MDIAFWRIWRSFALLTGIPMDYWFPLEKRDQSFKEYMQEFVLEQFSRQVRDVGLSLPWYWDHFAEEIETHHHTQQAGIWSWRHTVWWNPASGLRREERDWLERKYPGWNETYGKYWDVIIDNINRGDIERTQAIGMPCLCSMCQNTIANRGGTMWKARVYQYEYKGRRYNFCSPVCRWIFDIEPERYSHFNTIVDRLYNGEVDPPTPENRLAYMGIGVVSPGGRDAHDYQWAREYAPTAVAAE